MPTGEDGGVRGGVVGGDVQPRESRAVPDRAVGDDAGRAADLGAQPEDVADGAGRGVAAGLDDQHLARPDLLDRALLRVHPDVHRGQVLAQRQVAHRPGVSGHPQVGTGGAQPVQGEAVQAALAQQRGQRGGGHLAEPGEDLLRALRRGAAPAVGSRAHGIGGPGHGTERVEGVIRLGHGAAQSPRGLLRVFTRGDLDLHHVAGVHHGRARGRAGQDDVAGLQGGQPGQVGDDVAEAEQHVPGRPGILGQVPVDPGAQPDRGRVDGAGVDQPRAERGEAVDALGPHVGTAVGVPQVVHAEVVRGGDPGHVLPAVRAADPAGAAADDQRHLALEGKQFAAWRPGDRITAPGERGGGLEEIGRPGGCRAAFGRTAAVAEVHRDDLAGNALQGSHGAEIIYECPAVEPGCAGGLVLAGARGS